MNYNRLETIRKESGITILDICKAAGISRSVYHKLLNGGNITVNTLEKIAGVLRVDVVEFFKKDEEMIEREHEISYESFHEISKEVSTLLKEKDRQLKEKDMQISVLLKQLEFMREKLQ